MNFEKQIVQFFKKNYKAYSFEYLIKEFNIPEEYIDEFAEELYGLMTRGLLFQNSKGEYLNGKIGNFRYNTGLIIKSDNEYYIESKYIKGIGKVSTLTPVAKEEIERTGAKEGDHIFFEVELSKVKIKRIISKQTDIDEYKYITATIFKDPIEDEYYIVKNEERIPVDKNEAMAFHGDEVKAEIIIKDNEKKCIIKSTLHTITKKVFYYHDGEWKSFEDPSVRGILSTPIKQFENMKLLCEISEFNPESKTCLITPIKEIKHSNIKSDIVTYAYDHGFYKEYPDAVEEEMSLLPTYEEFQEEVNNTGAHSTGRRDLRNLMTFTIDPTTAKDLDDAVSLEILEDGTYRLYVHIADVTHFVKYDTETSKEARTRTTSCYLADEVFAMFPKKLSNELCSLNETGPKYTKTVQIDIDQTGKVINVELYKSIIQSNKQMNYDACNELLEEGTIPEGYEPFQRKLLEMEKLSCLLLQVRSERGMLEFESPEYTFEFNEANDPQNVFEYEHKTANIIIENFMILANNVLAEKAEKLGLPYVFRCHLQPGYYQIEQLSKQFDTFQSKTPKIPNIANPKSYRNFLHSVYDNYDEEESKHISEMALISMQRAYYDSENNGHYGLALDAYGFFTSPIRRYADYLNHLVWDEYLDPNSTPEKLEYLREEIKKITEYLSVRQAEEDFLEMVCDYNLLYDYATNFLDQKLTAKIEFITENEMFIKTENGIPGIIPVPKEAEFDKKTGILTYLDRTYHSGNTIEVYFVSKKEERRRKIEFQDAKDYELSILKLKKTNKKSGK